MKLLLRVAIIMMILGVALGACAPTPEIARPPLKIEWTLWPGDYPLVLAKDLGLFDKYGVQVEPVFYVLLANAKPDISSGKIDGARFAMDDFLVSVTNDNLHAVLITDVSNGADQVVASASINSPADLRGKRIGVRFNTFSEFFVRQMLKSQNISPNEVTMVDLDAELVPNAIPNQIDAGHTWAPYTNDALKRGEHVIFDSSKTPGLFPSVLALRTQVINERPQDVRALIAAWFEAIKYWQRNPDQSKLIVAKYANLNPQQINAGGVKIYTLQDNLNSFQRGADTNSIYYTAQVNLDFLINTGNITNPLDVYRLLDPTFVQQLSKVGP